MAEITQATIDAECALLGAILIEATTGTREAIAVVSGIVQPEDFWGYPCRHSRIYRAMLACREPPNQIVVAYEMQRLGILELYDCSWLGHLVVVCPCSLDYKRYANVVAEYARTRGVKHVAKASQFIGFEL